MASRSGAKPSLDAYCSAEGPSLASTAAEAAAKASTGKVLGEGRPPARLMMPGFSVTLRISRMTEGFMRSARRARVQGLVWGRSFSFTLGLLRWS